MAKVNLIGDRLKPEYVAEENERTILYYPYVIIFVYISLTNSEYFECIFNLAYSHNIITAILYQIIGAVFIMFPWLSVCFFIGQYTKETFLFTKYMSPIGYCAIIMHFSSCTLIASKFVTFPPVSKAIYFTYMMPDEDDKVWKYCSDEFREQLKYKENCTINTITELPGLCHARVTHELEPPNSFTDNIYQACFNTLVLYVFVILKFKTFCLMLLLSTGAYTFYYGTSLTYNFVRVSQIKMLKRVFSDSKMISSKNDTGSANLAALLFGRIIESLAVTSPNTILGGTQLSTDKSPCITALYCSGLQLFTILYYYFTFIGNEEYLADIYGIDSVCISASSTLSFYPILLSVHREALDATYEDQGKSGRTFITVFSLIMFRLIGFIYLASHCIGFCTIVKSSVSFFKNNRLAWHFLAIFICFAASMISHIGPMRNNLFDFYITPLACTLAFFFGFTFTFIVCSVYGPSALDTDYLFLNGARLTSMSLILIFLLPVIVFIYFGWRFYDWVRGQPWSIDYNDAKFLKVNKIPFYFPMLLIMAIVIGYALFVIIKELVRGNVSKAFFPNEKYGPWSPPGKNKIEERRNFHPETAVRFEGNYYRCLHQCWRNNNVIRAEIEQCRRTYTLVVDEIQQIGLSTLQPEIYMKYKDVLKSFQKVNNRSVILLGSTPSDDEFSLEISNTLTTSEDEEELNVTNYDEYEKQDGTNSPPTEMDQDPQTNSDQVDTREDKTA